MQVDLFFKIKYLKKLIIIRHAKSNQSFLGNDFERPLNERGLTDAPIMANRLKGTDIKIDNLIASPAIRAKKTAELFAETLQQPKDKIIFISALYHASAETFYEVVAGLADELNTVALFSHNPGITYFVNSLVSNVKLDNMPTCAIFAISADTHHWREFSKATKKMLFFDYPKK